MEVVLDGTRRLELDCVMQQDREHVRVRLWPRGGGGGGGVPGLEHAWALDFRHPLYPAPSDARLQGGGHGLVRSPMPGRISRVNRKAGDSVEEGDVVVVMEAMKMEHSIKAPCQGRIMELGHKPGDVVEDGAILFLVSDGVDDDASEQQLSS
jgi:hypothetical protein